jgi:hypothetical protein
MYWVKPSVNLHEESNSDKLWAFRLFSAKQKKLCLNKEIQTNKMKQKK